MLPSELCVITDRARTARPLTDVVMEIVSAGAHWIRVREVDLDLFAYVALCRALIESADESRVMWSVRPSAYLLLQSHYPETRFGVHLTGRDAPWAASSHNVLVGRSVHVGEPVPPVDDEIPHYLLLAPVFTTDAKPGVTPAGLHAVRAVASASARPVVALGGVTPANAAACRDAGAQAVAVCGAVFTNDAPGDVVREFLTPGTASRDTAAAASTCRRP